MQVRLDYGTRGLIVDVPPDATIVEPRDIPALPDARAAIAAALREPLAGRPLSGLVRASDRVAISVCDGTRPQPRHDMLAPLLSAIAHVPADRISIVIATGTHRPNTDAEVREMLGDDIVTRYPIVNHDARDMTTLARAGVTASGVPVMLNRVFLEADVRITTGVVEPHFFAGFSGGPKMVAPGLAGLDTVLELHNAARIGDPRATWGITEGNPVHDDVRDIARLVGVHFALDVTLNRHKAIAGVFAGELFAAHAAACAQARADSMSVVSGPFDVVLTSNSGYPLDQNLYQAVKGLSAAARIVKAGGTILCAAECRDGVPAHGSFAEVLALDGSPAGLLRAITAPGFLVPDQWQVQILATILSSARVMMKADGVPASALAAAQVEPIEDVSVAVRRALDEAGPWARLCVLPHGPRTVAVLG
ncbi:MAG: nickel-dependent lactate racemase [Vicinamibacterales bacterium]